MSFEAQEQEDKLRISEAESLRQELEKYVSSEEAINLSAEAYSKAAEIEKFVGPIARNPRVREAYSYDGLVFHHRKGGLIRFAPDGLHTLLSLRKRLLQYFEQMEKAEAINYFRKYLETRLRDSKELVDFWEKEGVLAKTEEVAPADDVALMSEEERKFFDRYEKQLDSERHVGKE